MWAPDCTHVMEPYTPELYDAVELTNMEEEPGLVIPLVDVETELAYTTSMGVWVVTVIILVCRLHPVAS